MQLNVNIVDYDSYYNLSKHYTISIFKSNQYLPFIFTNNASQPPTANNGDTSNHFNFSTISWHYQEQSQVALCHTFEMS